MQEKNKCLLFCILLLPLSLSEVDGEGEAGVVSCADPNDGLLMTDTLCSVVEISLKKKKHKIS